MNKTKPKALIIGQFFKIISFLPSLLHRAGFDVDAISNLTLLKKNIFISKIEIIVDPTALIERLSAMNLDIYDFIIVCDDATLKHILHSNLTISQKIKLLPVTNKESFKHIYSKIGLSQTLSDSGILTPPFAIAHNLSQAEKESMTIGFPVFIKIDSSSGGVGVFECHHLDDIRKLNNLNFPVLVQKKVSGTEIDLSAIYRDEKLLHFSYSSFEKVVENQFGPSVLRKYRQIGTLPKDIFQEMEKLGKAVGANGFTNITCIESKEENKRYFIECDMRPNTWVDFGKFLGNDPAINISKWFSNKEKLLIDFRVNKNFPETLLLPNFFRMTIIEILCNKYWVWRYLTKQDLKLLSFILIEKTNLPKLPNQLKHLLKQLKRLPTNIIRLFLPHKKDRARLKSKIKPFFNFF